MMSGDKDIENQIPEDLTQEDDLSMGGEDDHGAYVDDDLGATDFASEDEFAEDVGSDDFIEEDWESYDEESYIDDGDGDGLAERKAAFYKLIIGSAVIFAVGVGGYFVMSSRKEENLGAPVMEKVAGAVQVNPNERVEFHSETKVKPKDSFGVTYGKQDEVLAASPEEEAKREGLLNDPQALARLRNREAAVPTKLVVVDESNGNTAENDLPMPSPIAQAETGIQQDSGEAELVPRAPQPEPADGLIPMPERLGSSSSDKQDAGSLTKSALRESDVKDIVMPVEKSVQVGRAVESQVEAASSANSVQASAQSGDMAQLGEKLDRITDRLGRIESNMDQLDDLQASVSKLENRLTALEKAPARSATRSNVSTAPKSAPVTTEKAAPSRSAVRPVAKPATSKPAAVSWVLKSAQPGQAMVARKGGDDMYSVTVGESLDGIGKVTGIFVENGRWVVQGANGRISQ